MKLALHPVLGTVWALTLAARIYLAVCVRMRFKAFRVYVWASTLTGCLLFAQSASNAPEWYWYTYWTGEILLHLIAVWWLIFTCCDCMRFSPKFPDSLPLQATAVLIIAPLSCLGCEAIKRSPVEAIWYVEQALEVSCFALCYIAVLCSRIGYLEAENRRILYGFLALFSVGMAVSAVRVYFPLTRVELWATELWTQLAVVGWWIYAVRREA